MIGDDNVLGGTLLMFHAKEVTFRLLRWSLLGRVSGGWGRGGDDNVLDSTFLMLHLNEVTLSCCALFVVHELILLLLVPCGSCT